MKVRLAADAADTVKTGRTALGILPLLEGGLDDRQPGAPFLAGAVRSLVASAARSESFTARKGQILTVHLPAGGPAETLMLLGLGPPSGLSASAIRSAAGDAARKIPEGLRRGGPAALTLDPARLLAGGAEREPGGGAADLLDLPAFLQALAEGWILGGYSFSRLQTEKQPSPAPDLVIRIAGKGAWSRPAAREALRRAEVIASGVILARDLANAPANEINPVTLAAQARKLARSSGLACRILDEKAIRRERMGALLGVAQGSDTPPRFVVLRHQPRGRGGRQRPLVFVGKAITFDSGGLSIKPAKGMEEMKADMSGGAAVLAALGAIARLRLPVPVIGIIPCAENMISGRATRPGDVVRSRAGLTIEVINTDAEGRLILADALDYSRQFRPRLVVDLATLTGACVVALGDVTSGLVASAPGAAETVRKAAAASGERVWELPLHGEYFDALKSDVADLKNSGGRNAGAITAAAFLARFIEGTPWAHLDIAGTAWSDKEGGWRNKGATGFGVRLLVELARQSV